MKTLFRTLMFVPLIGLIAVTAAHAQVTETMRFHTTFPFSVGETTYPAGTFTVRPANDQFSIMEISNGTKTTVFMVEFERPTADQELTDQIVFKKYGDKYVLSKIWDSADGSGASVEMTPTEERLAEQGGSATIESVDSAR